MVPDACGDGGDVPDSVRVQRGEVVDGGDPAWGESVGGGVAQQGGSEEQRPDGRETTTAPSGSTVGTIAQIDA